MYFKRDTDYAIRIILSLAKAKKNGVPGLMLREICHETNTPMAAARRMLGILTENKIVCLFEQQGRGGIYYLGKKPDEINIMDIFRTVETNADILGNFEKDNIIYRQYSELLPYIERSIYKQFENLTIKKILSDNQL